jgi:GMP synthase-like glutamine amidotransferase
MKYLKSFLESDNQSVSIMDEDIKKYLPEEINIYTSNGNFTLKKDVITREIDILRICYDQNTPSENGGNVLADGEPDTLEFDMHFVKTDGKLKILVDISYGDQMVSEFSIQQPDKIDVIHYTGLGSKSDPDTHFGIADDSIKDLIKFFNAFGFTLDPKDFSFIDKYPETYIHEDVKLTPLSGNQKILIVNNSKAQENRYLKNLLKYMRTRGMEYVIATNDRDVERMVSQEKIVGAILSGSDHKHTKPFTKEEGLASKKALEILTCPILGICYGFQSMAKFHGSQIKDAGKTTIDNKKLTECDTYCSLFDGIDVEHCEFSFAFSDIVTSCPNGFKVIAKLDDTIAGISNESLKRYGVLFHPEDIERTFKMLDNFTRMFHSGQADAESLMTGKFERVKSFISFKKSSM